jgi:hypothetical protein
LANKAKRSEDFYMPNDRPLVPNPTRPDSADDREREILQSDLKKLHEDRGELIERLEKRFKPTVRNWAWTGAGVAFAFVSVIGGLNVSAFISRLNDLVREKVDDRLRKEMEDRLTPINAATAKLQADIIDANARMVAAKTDLGRLTDAANEVDKEREKWRNVLNKAQGEVTEKQRDSLSDFEKAKSEVESEKTTAIKRMNADAAGVHDSETGVIRSVAIEAEERKAAGRAGEAIQLARPILHEQLLRLFKHLRERESVHGSRIAESIQHWDQAREGELSGWIWLGVADSSGDQLNDWFKWSPQDRRKAKTPALDDFNEPDDFVLDRACFLRVAPPKKPDDIIATRTMLVKGTHVRTTGHYQTVAPFVADVSNGSQFWIEVTVGKEAQ